jgi:energy-coupling factor transporter ATP-binding protein EcfA2
MTIQASSVLESSELQFVRHRNYCASYKLLHAMSNFGAQGRLIMVTGPAGAGKSSMSKELEGSLTESKGCGDERRGKTVIRVIAKNPQLGFFNSKDFYSRLVEAAGDPFRASDPTSYSSIRVDRSEPSIQRALEKLLVARGITHLLVDEANLMCLNHSNRAPTDHLERLKVLAEELKLTIVLFGTYDMLQMWNHSSPLNRRNDLVHIEPYDVAVAADVREIRRVLGEWLKLMPTESGKTLRAHAKALGVASFGAIGQLSNIVSRAEKFRIARGGDSLCSDDLESAMPHLNQLRRGREEINSGNEAIQRVTLQFLESIDVASFDKSLGSARPSCKERKR